LNLKDVWKPEAQVLGFFLEKKWESHPKNAAEKNATKATINICDVPPQSNLVWLMELKSNDGNSR
jgi:hypothetical protein